MRNQWVMGSSAVVAACAFFSLGVSACLQTGGQRKSELRARAEELLPDDARVLVVGYGDCVELAESPSCIQIVFDLPEPDPRSRARLVLDEAKRNGWTVTHSDDAPGGWSVFVKRSGFTALVTLWRSAAYEVDCSDAPDPRSDEDRVCFNSLNLER
jgi:hypothetical protein